MRRRRALTARCAAIGCLPRHARLRASAADAPPPFKPVTTVVELMESVIAHAAEVYWDSVQVTVDETGEHEQLPANGRGVGVRLGRGARRSPSPAIY